LKGTSRKDQDCLYSGAFDNQGALKSEVYAHKKSDQGFVETHFPALRMCRIIKRLHSDFLFWNEERNAAIRAEARNYSTTVLTYFCAPLVLFPQPAVWRE